MTNRADRSEHDVLLAESLFDGPGEMRALCRSLDWSASPLGPTATWPISLRTLVATMLASPFPMFLWWGPDLVQFYNDAYRPAFTGQDRHPSALGKKGCDAWNGAWSVIEPKIARVLSGAAATLHEDELFSVVRGDRIEDVWWTYCYTPAFDDDGGVAGVLALCQETTARVRTEYHLTELTEALAKDRERLNRVLDASPSVMAVYSGPEHVITYVNPAWERFVGKSDGLGRTVRELFPEMISTGIWEHLDHVYETGEQFDVTEMRLPIHRDGNESVQDSYWSFLWTPLPGAYPVGPSGIGGDILCHATDVTAHVRAREASRKAEHQLRTLADAIPTLAWTSDADGYIDWYNARWYEYTGATPDEMEGWGWQSVHHPDVLPLVLSRWKASIESGQPFEMTFPLRGKDGTFRPFLTRGTPMRDESGRVTRWFGTNTDVEPEARLRREAEAANRSKSEFLAVMSHELRTPLNAIDGYAELMEMGIHGPLTDHQRRDLARIRKGQRHLLGLINEVLDYSRIEAGAVHYVIRSISVNEALTTCEALVTPQASAKRLTLHLNECENTLRVRTDGEKLQQIVLNLLTNAVKFTGAGGTIDMSCAWTDGEVSIAVSDTGCGIPADQLSRVFQPFVQLDAQLTRTQDGVGLGLAISRDLARGMGGDLTLTSEPGVGSTFTLTLPRAP